MNPPLILASSSPFRKELLNRLGIPFSCLSPDIDESALPQETAPDHCLRLALQKAQTIAADHPNAVVIGSDQLPVLGNQRLSKPGTNDKAVAQLMASQGKTVTFYTSLAVLCPHSELRTHLNTTRVRFRTLTQEAVERYVAQEDVLRCAGGFKMEGLGISLFESIESDDPTALIGLPLIQTAALLRESGYLLP